MEKAELTHRNSVELLLLAKELENNKETERAIEIYESMIQNNFDGNRPYDRLCTIFRKNKRFDDEIRILERAIYVFENLVYRERGDRIPKLKKFQERLLKTLELKEKSK